MIMDPELDIVSTLLKERSFLAVHESNTHYQDYCDLSFEPSVIAVHPDNSLDPDAAALSYGSKLLVLILVLMLLSPRP
jgi:hypothetical protein